MAIRKWGREKLDKAVYLCNPSIWEAKAERSQV
jgi:hypothetical protein